LAFAGALVAAAFGFAAGVVAAVVAAMGFAGSAAGLALMVAAANLAAGWVARLGGAAGAPALLTTTRGARSRDDAAETFESAVFRPADAPCAGVFLALPFGSAI
jgi:hypothetical protein